MSQFSLFAFGVREKNLSKQYGLRLTHVSQIMIDNHKQLVANDLEGSGMQLDGIC